MNLFRLRSSKKARIFDSRVAWWYVNLLVVEQKSLHSVSERSLSCMLLYFIFCWARSRSHSSDSVARRRRPAAARARGRRRGGGCIPGTRCSADDTNRSLPRALEILLRLHSEVRKRSVRGRCERAAFQIGSGGRGQQGAGCRAGGYVDEL